MIKIYQLFLLIIISYSTILGQSNKSISAVITGKIYDIDANVPLEFATLSVYDQKNDALIGGTITEMDGTFSIEVKPGIYYLVAEFISYQKKTVNDIIVKQKGDIVNIGSVDLAMDGETLQEVVITERKSQVQLSLDKKVFNVGSDLTNKGGTAEDILDNVPSVTVDLDGNVSLRGSGGVRILIDGKPSTMVGPGNANGLRNISANMIERVEVITNPSARYEAEGMSGIINIVLKKDRKNGFNGSVDLTGGIPLTYGSAVNLNYRRNNFNFFSSFGLRQQNNPGRGNSFQQTTLNSGETTIFSTDRSFARNGLSNNLNLGMDYFIDDNNILTSSFSFRRSIEKNDNLTIYNDFLGSRDNLLSITNRYNDEEENEYDTEYALTYERKLPGKDHTLIADFRFQDNSELNNSDFREEYLDELNIPTGANDFFQQSSNNEGERRINIKIDYTKPLANKGKFETGMQSSYRLIDNDYLVEELINDEWIRLAGLSNDFNYNEYINAIYGMYGKEYTSWSYQIGLRGEHSRVITQLLQSDQAPNDRSYLNLFPSAHLSYKLGESNAFQISYSRRLNRPRFWDLNPFFTFSDPRNQFSGNPDLDPEFTNAFELGHIAYFEKGSLTSSIYYRKTNNVINRITTVIDGVNFTKPENLLSQDDYGFEFTGSLELVKWWNLNGNLNLFRSITDGGNLGDDFNADTYSWFTRVNNRFKFSKTTEAQVRINYNAPRETAQGRSLSTGSVDLGFGKEFPDKNISITFNVRDLFNTRLRRFVNDFALTDEGGIVYGQFYSEGEFQWRSRQAVVSLNYRINQDKNRRDKRGEGGFDGGGEMF